CSLVELERIFGGSGRNLGSGDGSWCFVPIEAANQVAGARIQTGLLVRPVVQRDVEGIAIGAMVAAQGAREDHVFRVLIIQRQISAVASAREILGLSAQSPVDQGARLKDRERARESQLLQGLPIIVEGYSLTALVIGLDVDLIDIVALGSQVLLFL